MENSSLAAIRREYTLKGLDLTDVAPDPFRQFTVWFEEAVQAQVIEPNAMHLSTVTLENRPAGRIVLLKAVDTRGFTFFTNYQSRKGHELDRMPYAALTFFWPELERQVRIEGRIEKVSEEESDAYFQSRPRGSQLGAWVSAQSQVIEDRATLETILEKYVQKFEGQSVPRPPYWGGFRLLPDFFEFWQGRPSRLHDRISYTFLEGAAWSLARLSP